MGPVTEFTGRTAHVADAGGPIGSADRIVALDILRGFALLGILVVNVEVFRGADLFRTLAGRDLVRTPADEVAQFVIGWLVGGKFLSSFALLFGVGATLMARRARVAGVSAHRLLARRYGWLLVFGIAHMLLLFAADILFVYGLAGLLLLPFLRLRARGAATAAGVIAGGYLFGVLLFAAAALEPPADSGFEEFLAERTAATVTAYTIGGPGDQLAARAWEALIIQGGQLLELPWVLSLFLAGYAIGNTRLLTEPLGAAKHLRRVVAFALPAGLVLNLPIGLEGALGAVPAGTPGDHSQWSLAALSVVQVLGVPLLAAGYLAGLALVCSRPGAVRRLEPLSAVGRMALTGYVAQSVACTAFFVWLGNYDRFSTVATLPVVLVVWALLLTGCTAWLRRFHRGPLEHLWRRLTYQRRAL